MEQNLVSDADLVRSYLLGNERAFEKLLTRHETKVFNFIYSKVLDVDVANDIFQDTFIKVIKTLKKNKYNEEGKFLPWVMRISKNLVIDYFRKKTKSPVLQNRDDGLDLFNIINDPTLNIERQLIKDQIYSELRDLIKELPENQRIVLEMRHFKDMSFKEISENSDVSINTALGRMRYALINLRKLIRKKNLNLTKI